MVKFLDPIGRQGGGGVRGTLSGRTQKITPPEPSMPPGVTAQLGSELSKIATRYLEREADKSDRAKMREILMAYRKGTPGEKKIIDLPESEIIKQYGDPAAKTELGWIDPDETEEDQAMRATDARELAMPELDDQGRRFTQEHLEGLAAARHVAGKGYLGPTSERMLETLMMNELTRSQGMADWLTKERHKYRPPKTVKTAEGVYILNPDSSRGTRLGGAAADTEITIGTAGKLKKGYRRTAFGAEPIPGGSEDPKTVERKKEAERKAALNIENIKKLPGRRSAIYASTLNAPTFDKAIENAISESASMFSSGITQQLLGDIAYGPAFELERSLDTIKSNIGFGELLRIKEAGGTLGALSEMENRLLQAMQGALDARIKKEKLIPALKKVQEIYYLNLEEKKRAFKEMYPKEERPWEKAKAPVIDNKSTFDAYYNSLQSGAEYIDPQGKRRIKQ